MKRALIGGVSCIAVCIGLYLVMPFIGSWTTVRQSAWASLFGAGTLAVAFVGASLSCGAAVIRRLTPAVIDGFWPIAFATGAGLFALSTGFAAWFQWLGPVFFVAQPVLFFCVGLPTVVRELSLRPIQPKPWSLGALTVLGAGCVGIILTVIQSVSSDSFNYDAGWYHLRAAERYALAGGMVRVNEGDLLLTLPQTASWLYTWAFCWPGVLSDDRVRLSLMLECCTVLGTLALIPPLVRVLMPSLPPMATRLSWVSFFLFPSLFIYDTGIMGGADHVVSLFGISAVLVWFVVRRFTSIGPWVLFGIHVACLLAKYSSLYVLIPLGLVVAIDWFRGWKEGLRWAPVIAGLCAILLTSPYWLRNVAWYHNPVYPVASRVFPSTPWNPDAEAWMLNTQESTQWSLNGIPSSRVRITLKAFFTHVTELNTWGDMTNNQPILGAAYFLSLFVLPFIPARRRLALIAFIVHGGIVVWYNTHQHQMRYLTVLFGPMSAAASVTAIWLWREGWLLGRGAVALTVAYHLVVYGDVPFRKTHRMAGNQSIVGLFTNWVERGGQGRSARLASWEALGDQLPPTAKPLVHGIFPHLGLRRQSVTDVTGLQFGINYGRWGSQNEILRQLKKMGVTHIIQNPGSEQSDSVSGEALFQGLATQLVEAKSVSGFNMGELPETARELRGGILYVGCANLFETGLYTIESLKVPVVPWYHPWPKVEPVERAPSGNWQSLLGKASYVAMEIDCNGAPPGPEFTHMSDQVGFPRRLRHFVRTTGDALPLEAAN
jgi:hypothetical protein